MKEDVQKQHSTSDNSQEQMGGEVDVYYLGGQWIDALGKALYFFQTQTTLFLLPVASQVCPKRLKVVLLNSRQNKATLFMKF